MLKLASAAVLVLAVVASGQANAWTIDQDFDDESPGAVCGGWDSSQSVVSTDRAASGTKSCKQVISKGDTGFGVWGGILTLPARLTKGGEFWVRVRTFMPIGFNYNSSAEGAHLKFLRLHTMSPSQSNQGYNDWYINPKGDPSPHKFIFEGEQVWSYVSDPSTAPVLGVWETYEMYVKLDSVPKSRGGTAVVRFWKNGELIGEFPDRQTLVGTDSYADRFHFFTYWNGGSPQTQQMYMDDVVLTSETPSSRDSAGNPYIGVGDRVVPKAPSSVVVD